MQSGIGSLSVLSSYYFPSRKVPKPGSMKWHRRLAEIEYLEDRLISLQAGAIAKALGG